MSVGYAAVGWNRQKKIYDWLIFGFCVLYLLIFVVLTASFNPDYTFETVSYSFYFYPGCFITAYNIKHRPARKTE
jgi:hypothetical protein